MLTTAKGKRGIAVAPHHLASEAGLGVLRGGGSAVDAAVATAAALAVVYPHMNSIGGDSFWLVSRPGQPPIAIDACGRAGAGVDLDLYRRAGLDAVPARGPLAANTVAGTISGWEAVLAAGPSRLPLGRLLAPAIGHARDGVTLTAGFETTLAAKRAELEDVSGFADLFLPGDRTLAAGDVLRQPALARTLERLIEDGLDGFYSGALAADLAADLAAAGAPITATDLAAHRATQTTALSVRLHDATVFNMPPPTQGLASLLILALFDRLGVTTQDGFEHLHGIIEATKRAFLIRDRHVGDPAFMTLDPQALLDDGAELDRLAALIDSRRALPWPQPPSAGDTVWFGAIDEDGCAVSAIQSTYFEFGSGVTLPRTGVVWQNRGSSFRLAADGWNALRPGRKPFHTLNPALARFDDGRLMAYGTMGGEGQPQTQAAIFTRYARFGQDLQEAVSAPRWLLGRTWGEQSVTLKLEDRFDPAVIEALRNAGHSIELLPTFSSVMGHAGALVRHADGSLEGAADPRSDGAALAL